MGQGGGGTGTGTGSWAERGGEGGVWMQGEDLNTQLQQLHTVFTDFDTLVQIMDHLPPEYIISPLPRREEGAEMMMQVLSLEPDLDGSMRIVGRIHLGAAGGEGGGGMFWEVLHTQLQDLHTLVTDIDHRGNVLPPDWTEHVDPSSSEKYYVNQTSGESTWDRPAQAKVAAPSTVGATASTAKAAAPSTDAQAKVAAPSTAGWWRGWWGTGGWRGRSWWGAGEGGEKTVVGREAGTRDPQGQEEYLSSQLYREGHLKSRF